MTVRAAIDVGSNSLKLLVLDIMPDASYRILHDEARVSGLGRGLGSGGLLPEEGVAASLAILAEYRATALRLGAESPRAAGTSALRRANDAADFIARVGRETGIRIEVISGAEEARLSRAVALRELPPGASDVVLFDVGGGSTELTWCREGEVRCANSIEIGARRLTDDVRLTHPVDESVAQRLDEIVSAALSAAPGPQAPADSAGEGGFRPRLAGLGGTASELVWIERGAQGLPKGDPHLARIGADALLQLRARLSRLRLDEIRALPNAEAKRADVLYAGCALILGILAHYSAEYFTLSDRGLRFGLLLG